MNKPLTIIKPWIGQLRSAALEERPHRFAIAVTFKNNKKSLAHCVNSGRGEGMIRSGAKIWLSKKNYAHRSLKWTWELSSRNGILVGTNSTVANNLIEGILTARQIAGLKSVKKILREHKIGRKRIDLLAILSNGTKHFIEVKNCHLKYPDGKAYFPDSHSPRSRSHLLTLRSCVRNGDKASLFIAVQRTDVTVVRPSDFHDPQFSRSLRSAFLYGVNVRAFSFKPTVNGFIDHRNAKKS